MDAALLALPLPIEALPEELHRFLGPSVPVSTRTLAARGLVPFHPPELVTVLVQLAHDEDASVRETARTTVGTLPEAVLLPACEATVHAAVLDKLADLRGTSPGVLDRIVSNHATADATVARIARTADDALCEIVATNQQRLLGAPSIIEALYKNKNARMSTVDRIVELAARHGVEVHGIPSFADHVRAIQGMLIPEATSQPLPGDAAFAEALAADADDPDAIDQDPADGTESVRERYKPLRHKISEMTTSEKIRLAMIGNAAARAILVRDSNRIVSIAAISSPAVTDLEARAIAQSREVSDEILRFIGTRRMWLRNHEVKRALVFNPKTPIGIALQFVGHMIEADLRGLGRSRNVAGPIKRAALQKLAKKERR